jgi:hypothetical protein
MGLGVYPVQIFCFLSLEVEEWKDIDCLPAPTAEVTEQRERIDRKKTPHF